jgi:hypothetical protein
LCVAERYTVAERGIEYVGEEPWELAFRGEVSILLYAEVEVVVLWLRRTRKAWLLTPTQETSVPMLFRTGTI